MQLSPENAVRVRNKRRRGGLRHVPQTQFQTMQLHNRGPTPNQMVSYACLSQPAAQREKDRKALVYQTTDGVLNQKT